MCVYVYTCTYLISKLCGANQETSPSLWAINYLAKLGVIIEFVTYLQFNSNGLYLLCHSILILVNATHSAFRDYVLYVENLAHGSGNPSK